jgi:hypothetical protein
MVPEVWHPPASGPIPRSLFQHPLQAGFQSPHLGKLVGQVEGPARSISTTPVIVSGCCGRWLWPCAGSTPERMAAEQLTRAPAGKRELGGPLGQGGGGGAGP